MSKLDLKAAMDSLQVKTPLKLQAKAPSFRVPAAPISSTNTLDPWVQNQSQDLKSSLDETRTLDVIQSKDQNVSQDLIESLDAKPSLDQKRSSDEIQSQDLNASMDANTSQVLKSSVDANQPQDQIISKDSNLSLDVNQSMVPIESLDLVQSLDMNTSQDENSTQVVFRSTQPRKATEQDRAVTETKSVQSRLSTGYTRIPNALLMSMASGDLSRNEMKLLLLIARMTISFNRPMASLSKGVLERMSHIQGRAVLDALQTLEAKGHIKKVAGDHNSPNRLGLTEYDTIEQTSKQPFVRKATQGEKRSKDLKSSQDEIRIRDVSSTQGWDENSPYKKDKLETKKEKLSLSTQIQTEYFTKYFDEVKPRRKRETELQAFRELKSDFSEADISLALEHVLKHGMPGSGEACHSPMAYLAKAIGQVLGIAKSGQEKQRQKQDREATEIRAKEAQKAEEEREMQNSLLREQEFQKSFPGELEQAEVIANFGRKFPMLAQRGPLLRNLAISAWWDEMQSR